MKIGVDVQGFQQNMALASSSVEGFVKSADKTAGGLRVLGIAATAAGVAIVAAMGFAVKAAAEAEAVNRRLVAALESAGEEAPKVAAEISLLALALERQSTSSDEAIKTNAALLISMGATSDEAKALLPGILDLSAAIGIDFESAARAVGKALNGNVAILQRYGVQVGENIPATERLAALQRALGQRAGAAQAQTETFTGSLIVLRNQINNLQEIMGRGFLQPLTRLIQALTTGVVAITGFLERNQALAQGLGILALAFGVLLITGGGLLLFASLLTKIIGLMTSLAAASGTLAGVLRGLAGAIRLVGLALKSLTVIGLIVGAIALLLEALGGFERGLTTIGAFIVTFVEEVVRGFAKIAEAFATFNPKKLIEGFKQIAGSAGKAIDEAARINVEMERMEEAGKSGAKGARVLAKSLEEVTEEAELARLGVERFVAEADAAAAKSARLTLEAPGLSETQVNAATQRLEAARERNAVEGAQRRLRIEEDLLRDIEKASDKTTVAVEKQQTAVAKARLDLIAKELEAVENRAKRIVEVEKALRDERLAVEQELLQARLDIIKSGIQTEADLVKLRIQADQDAAARRLDQIKRDEDFRLSVLQRVATLEGALQQAVLSARQALVEANFKREEAAFRIQAQRRAQLVKDGLLTEEEAREATGLAMLALAKKRADADLAQEQARIRLINAQANIELGLAAANFAAKQRVLLAETAARKAQLGAEFALKIADLTATEGILRAQTEAKIKQLELQLTAAKLAIRAEFEARAAAGGVSAEERRAFEERLALVDKQFKSGVDAARAAVIDEQKRAGAQVAALQKSQADVTLALDEATKQQLLAAEVEFQAAVLDAKGKQATQSAQIASRVVDIETRLADSIEAERNRLRDARFTEAEIQQRLLPSTTLLNNIKAFTQGLTRETDSQLTVLENLYKGFALRLQTILQPLLDMVDKLSNPQRLNELLDRLKPFLVPTVGAAPAALAGAGGVTTQFNFNGVTMTLTADETNLLQRLIAKMLGPEGRRILEDLFKKQPGPR